MTVLLDFRSNPLRNRVERREFLCRPSRPKVILGSGEILHVETYDEFGGMVDGRWGEGTDLQPNDCDLVDGIKGFDVMRRSEHGDSHEPVRVDVGGDVGLIERELVGRKSPGLIRAKHIDACTFELKHY